jgi:hypothetical protein
MTRGGGQLQLIAEGKEDIFLSGNPQISFFKKIYRRHTPFAIESMPMYFQGSLDFGKRMVCEVPRSGDLLGPLFLEVELPALKFTTGIPAPYVNSVGHALIKEISIEIGEDQIDRQTGEWMEIWSQHTVSASQRAAFNEMIGRKEGYGLSTLTGAQTLTIPLHFWFCTNPGLYLPLIAMKAQKIRIVLLLRGLDEIVAKTHSTQCVQPAQIDDVKLWGDYVHLSVEERRRFVSSEAIDYLIEQVQYTPYNSIPAKALSASIAVEFNHPVKEFFWWIRPDRLEEYNEWMNFSSLAASEAQTGQRQDILIDAVIQLDGLDRFDVRPAKYFRIIQPYQRHTYNPFDRYIYSYSFAISPEQESPSGTMNLTEINSVNFLFNVREVVPERGSCTCRIYAKNYNILRIVDSMAAVLFRS